jgi:uncharacterized protein YqeY
MSLAEKIATDFNRALKSGDKVRVAILRMVKSAIKNREIEKGEALGDDEIEGVFRSFVKRAKESIEQFSKAERTDLVEKEKAELAIIQEYLPKQLSEDETREIIRNAIAETGASGPQDMGKVMKAVMAKGRGLVDGKLANILLKEMLEA